MKIVWRYINKKQENAPFSAYGTEQFGTRWNSKGRAIVLAASSKSLAYVEFLFYSHRLRNEFNMSIDDYVFIPIVIPSTVLIKNLDTDSLCKGWVNNYETTINTGDQWFDNQESCVLSVPSEFVPREKYYLINPNHNDFTHVASGPPESLGFLANGMGDLEKILNHKNVFICHASEDKAGIARPLYNALTINGISCWIDEAEISWGDSLIEKVNDGMKNSSYTIVILTANFINKKWPQRELRAALNKETSEGKKLVLPILSGTEMEIKSIVDEYFLMNDKLYMKWVGETAPIVEALKAVLNNHH